MKVFSTARSAKNFLNEFYRKFPTKLPPVCLTLSDFFASAIIAKGLRRVDEITRVMLMQEAVLSVKNSVKLREIPREFFSFLNNGGYIFAMRQELKGEKITAKTLKTNDLNAEFDEHFAILDELFESYDKLLEKNGFYDAIPPHWEVNHPFLEEEIEFYLDGIFSGFECEVLQQIAQTNVVKIKFETDEFSLKLRQKLLDKLGFTQPLKAGCVYEAQLQTKQLLVCGELKAAKNDLVFTSFAEPMTQNAFVFDSVNEMLLRGIAPEKIAVILPDEKFGELLLELDENGSFKQERVLNFAMGVSFVRRREFMVLNACYAALEENFGMLKELLDTGGLKEYVRQKNFGLNIHISQLSNCPQEALEKLANSWREKLSFGEFREAVLALIANEEASENPLQTQVRQMAFGVVEETLFLLRKASERFSVGELVSLLLILLKKQTLNDFQGGGVGVMGVLESRGMSFEGVVIVDFNDEVVPTKVEGELFLNEAIRRKSGMILHEDRENLQRSFYARVLRQASVVRIACVENSQRMPSRFATQLNLVKQEANEEAFEKLLLSRDEAKGAAENVKFEFGTLTSADLFGEDGKLPISYSRFNCYEECKLEYFYKYKARIGNGKLFENEKEFITVGLVAHEVLQEALQESPKRLEAQRLEATFRQKAKAAGVDEFEIECFVCGLEDVAQKLNEYLREFSVFACEKAFEGVWVSEGKFCLEGTIDCVLVKESGGVKEFRILDFKTGKANDKSAQLAFYELLLRSEVGQEAVITGEFLQIYRGGCKVVAPSAKLTPDAIIERLAEAKTRLANGVVIRHNSKCKRCQTTSWALKEFEYLTQKNGVEDEEENES